MITEIIDEISWTNTLELIGAYDCYHTYDFHRISAAESETPMLLVFQEASGIIALPLVLRKIEGTDRWDFTSVYGYPGPLCTAGINDDSIRKFNLALKEYFIRREIVSVFSRLNPFVKNQNNLLEFLGDIETAGEVVYIDIRAEESEQHEQYSNMTKRYVKKGRKLFALSESDDYKDVDLFMGLYYENMERVKAKNQYYFSKDYFNSLIRSKTIQAKIYFAEYLMTGEIVSALMTLECNGIVHYHLSGTKDKFLKYTPLRFLIDGVREQLTSKNHTEIFNLGGGVGGQQDSLYQFKSSFSKYHSNFKIWKYVVDPKGYLDLVARKSVRTNSEFFPEYRSS